MKIFPGDIGWSGVSGVPGLGCTVKNKYSHAPALHLWEDHSHSVTSKQKYDRNQKLQSQSQSQSLGDKIVSIFGLKRGSSMKSPESAVCLPKVSVRRSNTISSVAPKMRSGIRES